jgi:hypothetical protein
MPRRAICGMIARRRSAVRYERRDHPAEAARPWAWAAPAESAV